TDASRTIVAVGSWVRRCSPGDMVHSYMSGNPKGGCYAEYAALDAGRVGRLPGILSLKEAAAVPTTGLTAIQGIDDVLHVKRGEAVVIHGASAASAASRSSSRRCAVRASWRRRPGEMASRSCAVS